MGLEMNRRCTDGMCLMMAGARTFNLDLPVATILSNPRHDWNMLTAGGRLRVAREIDVDWKKFNQDNFLFSHCFVPGTMVLMGDGTEKSIEQVVKGDMVVSHTGCVRRVTAVMIREVDEELVVVKSASLQEMASTGEHPYFILPKGQASCNRYDGKKCVYGHTGRCKKNECGDNGGVMSFVRADALAIGDRTFLPTMNKVVDVGFTKNQMRLLGYYISEGGLAKDDREGESNSVRFHISKLEIDTLGTEISNLMMECFRVGTHGTIETEEQGGTTLSFASDAAYAWCEKHVGHIANQKRLSEDVMFSPPDMQAEMMDTWIKGDGNVDRVKRSIRLSTASPFLASQAEVLFGRIGGMGNIYEGVNPGGPTGRDKIFPIFQISVKSSELGKLEGRYEFPKFSRWARTGQRYRHAACSVSEVTRLSRRQYKGLVYNLSVAQDESYVVNRMAVHNCTIVASVELEDDGHTIKSACNELVNNNGNAWSNEVLLSTFKSFVGGENYLEHVQVPELSKGKILDAVARPVHFKGARGEANIYYIDILVATNRKHDELVGKIASGELTTLSMGCLADYVQCSKCGKVLGDNDPNCSHLDNEMLHKYIDKKGVQRIVSELCGRTVMKGGKRVGDTKSCKFIEASWVAKPAFTGAVLNHYIGDISKEAAKILAFPTWKLSEAMDDIFKLRVADRAGMLVLKVARTELMRRKHEAMIERIIR